MEIETLGIPKNKVTQFQKKGLFTVEDLARFFPRKYYDFRKITPISQVKDKEVVAIVGTLEEVIVSNKLVRAKVRDNSGKNLYVLWFGNPYLAKKLKTKETYIFCGKIRIDTEYNTRQMASPMFFGTDIKAYQRIIPVYSKIQGMSTDYLMDSIRSALAVADKSDYVEPLLLNKFNIPKNAVALRAMHEPKDEKELQIAQRRFVFDDLFLFGMQLANQQQGVVSRSPFVMPTCNTIKRFMDNLPFDLTDGQRQALRSIYLKMRKGERVNALVQGDVGSGKTIVAFILMLISAENGFQSVLMAPTTVLAKQHYLELIEKTKDMGYKVGFLSGDMKAKEKKEIIKGIESGEIQLVVGTHAVIQKDVAFQNLALTIVDEEHRFGVVQRNELNEKAKHGVHQVTMSATPIPRTLAMSVYGDSVDVLTITTMPKGRKPVQTIQIRNEDKAYEAMYRQIKQGRQCYVVCPLIEDSESEALADVDSVEATFDKMKKFYNKYPEVNIAMISGKMKQSEITEEIAKFSQNKYDIIISTTIIEVGVNVPNATVILIKNAERFGLAQLHQLRGRVGRGSHQSYCVLLSEEKENPKLKAMCDTTDGFKIAEKDLELRGTGDFIGTKQSGNNKYVMLMLSNPNFFEKVKEEVNRIYTEPNRLARYTFLNEKNIGNK
ncbi:ATP-dependent DNA helicase RecG (plasmid) [Aneurinibacillus sp. Ricciae_BoGa-3]|uniref:ATP-dependent DNA helicase RecG n=1 Tax=Aneurinibacillus sp. Ricciae_BoGa-3 TaxID=3022697 RepID=UPI0023416840|nr:ATP-dependent DNA helicase RecG [Aneurinibacillus sp. Ricciae_BoGa-3]WCK57040.1 ATP-dependent DNA helicase RecG [Aneurinibacillus sp. Ricciae_BoGa-3]